MRTLLRRGTLVTPDFPGLADHRLDDRGFDGLIAAGSPGALLVVDGRIAWVGPERDVDSHRDEADQVIDLDGCLVTPGFVDAHVHLARTGEAIRTLDLSTAASLAEALDLLAGYARVRPDGVVRAHGWDESDWPEARPPTATEVDHAVAGRPACLTRVDGHSAVVSWGLVRLLPALSGQEGWTPEGQVSRAALRSMHQLLDAGISRSDRKELLRIALHRAAECGLTAVHELNAPHISSVEDFALLDEIAAEEAVVDVARYWGALEGGGAEHDGGLLGYAGDLTVDGAIGSRTAGLRDAYADAPTSGHLYLTAGQVTDHVVWCHRRGVQAGFHVIGDLALDVCLEGFERAAEVVGLAALRAERHRLEHVEMPSPAVVEALAGYGIVASVQPVFDALWGGPDGLYERRLGPARAAGMNPFATMHERGVPLAFGSDSPVTPLAPWEAIRAAVWHHDEAQRLPYRAAFEAHTVGGHRARRHDKAGRLIPGQPADLVQWETVELPDLRPGSPLPVARRTLVNGVTVYTAESPARHVPGDVAADVPADVAMNAAAARSFAEEGR